jgi:hypothetical protein
MNLPIFNVPSDLKFSSKTMSEPQFAGKFSEFLKGSGPLSKEEAEAKELSAKAEVYGALPEFLKNLAWQSSKEGMEAQLEMARKDAFQKGQAGLMFSTLANIPQAIANAASPFGGPVGARMVYESISRRPGIYSETMRSFPQIQVPASSYSPTKYF